MPRKRKEYEGMFRREIRVKSTRRRGVSETIPNLLEFVFVPVNRGFLIFIRNFTRKFEKLCGLKFFFFFYQLSVHFQILFVSLIFNFIIL